MDIVKIKDTGSQILMYKGKKHSMIKYKDYKQYFVKFEPKTTNDFVLSTIRYAPTGYTTYMSGPSSYNVDNGYSLAKITFYGYEVFQFYYTSYAESSYDYLMISKLGEDWSNKTNTLEYNDSSVYLHTRGNQSTTFTQGKFIDLDPTVEYSFWIMYRKDSSVNSNDDRGYFGISNTEPKTSKRYYWLVNSALFVNETLQDSKTYSFTISAITQKGHELFGTASSLDTSDFRIFWNSNVLYFDSNSSRSQINGTDIKCSYTDIITYEVEKSPRLLVYKNLKEVASLEPSDYYKWSEPLGFILYGSEELYFYEFKVIDSGNNIIKHYIPLGDGHTLYDVISETTVDTGTTFQVFKSYEETNQKGELIPYKN